MVTLSVVVLEPGRRKGGGDSAWGCVKASFLRLPTFWGSCRFGTLLFRSAFPVVELVQPLSSARRGAADEPPPDCGQSLDVQVGGQQCLIVRIG